MGMIALPSPERPITFRLAQRRLLATIETRSAVSLGFQACHDFDVGFKRSVDWTLIRDLYEFRTLFLTHVRPEERRVGQEGRSRRTRDE